MKELRDKIAKENSFDDWDDLCFHYGELCSINRFDKLTKFVDEFAQRYAQSQTLELQEQNAELVEMLKDVKGYLGSDKRNEVDALLTKHNHLNKK